jgi:hypothetical protein
VRLVRAYAPLSTPNIGGQCDITETLHKVALYNKGTNHRAMAITLHCKPLIELKSRQIPGSPDRPGESD